MGDEDKQFDATPRKLEQARNNLMPPQGNLNRQEKKVRL